MRQYAFLFLVAFFIGEIVLAQTPEVLKIRDYGNKNAGSIINEFSEFLTIPNVAADAEGQQKTAAFIMGMMNKRVI